MHANFSSKQRFTNKLRLGQVWCLIVSIPDLCHLSYLTLVYHHVTCLQANRSYLILCIKI